MRIVKHPILNFPEREPITFIFEGKEVQGFKGDTIASALHALGVKTLSFSIKEHRLLQSGKLLNPTGITPSIPRITGYH